MPNSRPSASRDELVDLALTNAQKHALILADTAGRIVAWEMAARDLFGYTAEEIQGEPLSRLFTPEDLAQGLSEYEMRIAVENVKAEDDRWHVRKDGTRIWVSGILTALRDAAGRHVGFCKIMRDRTDVKAHVENLENRIETLTNSAENRERLLTLLTHDLGNTLYLLGLSLAVVRSGPIDDGLNQMLATCEYQLGVGQRLLDDLREVWRVRSGNILLRKTEVNLNDLVSKTVDSCQSMASERRQRLEALLPRGTIHVQADPVRLHQVLVNLVNNACKYTPEEGRIWVKLTTEGEDATIKVEDNGVGIGPDMLPRLFQMFTQEEQSRALSRGGLGVGLWLVKNLIELHDGSVAVRSDGRGRGSEFTVRLRSKNPVHGLDARAEHSTQPESDADAAGATPSED